MKTGIGLAVFALSVVVTAAVIVQDRDQASQTVRSLRSAGYVLEGRDPSNGSLWWRDQVVARSNGDIAFEGFKDLTIGTKRDNAEGFCCAVFRTTDSAVVTARDETGRSLDLKVCWDDARFEDLSLNEARSQNEAECESA